MTLNAMPHEVLVSKSVLFSYVSAGNDESGFQSDATSSTYHFLDLTCKALFKIPLKQKPKWS